MLSKWLDRIFADRARPVAHHAAVGQDRPPIPRELPTTAQAVRFPLAAHGMPVAVIAAGVAFSAAARVAVARSTIQAYATAFVVALAFFFRLPLAGEFEDYGGDSRSRPYRAAPRRVATLRELATVVGRERRAGRAHRAV